MIGPHHVADGSRKKNVKMEGASGSTERREGEMCGERKREINSRRSCSSPSDLRSSTPRRCFIPPLLPLFSPFFLFFPPLSPSLLEERDALPRVYAVVVVVVFGFVFPAKFPAYKLLPPLCLEFSLVSPLPPPFRVSDPLLFIFLTHKPRWFTVVRLS